MLREEELQACLVQVKQLSMKILRAQSQDEKNSLFQEIESVRGRAFALLGQCEDEESEEIRFGGLKLVTD